MARIAQTVDGNLGARSLAAHARSWTTRRKRSSCRLCSGDLGRIGALLRPIAVPLIATGFDAAVIDPFSPSFAAAGFVPMTSAKQTQSVSAASRSDHRLAPGDAVGVALLTGDFELGATGTVTHVDGDRVYAFGHPLYNLGPTQFPMTAPTCRRCCRA